MLARLAFDHCVVPIVLVGYGVAGAPLLLGDDSGRQVDRHHAVSALRSGLEMHVVYIMIGEAL
jgi:hypothetical protein